MAESIKEIYTTDYFLDRCGGLEFYKKYGAQVLKPVLQAAVKSADLKPHYKILDIGCGRGELVSHLTQRGFDVLGIDFSEGAIQIAQKLDPHGKYKCTRLEEGGFKDKFYDCIFFLGTIEHIHDDEIKIILAEIMRILKPGGRLVVSTCTNALYYKTKTYSWRYVFSRIFHLTPPAPPRSVDDLEMHINEQHYFSLKKHFVGFPFRIQVVPQANPKLTTEALYGSPLPEGFPVRRASRAKQKWYRRLAFWFPVNLILARNYLLIAEKEKYSSHP